MKCLAVYVSNTLLSTQAAEALQVDFMIAKLELGKLGRSADLQDAQGSSKLRSACFKFRESQIMRSQKVIWKQISVQCISRRYLINITAHVESYLITTN